MASVNKVILIGNLGQDPEIKHTPSGDAVCNFSIACNESWTKDGEKHEKTEWVRIVAWRKIAELCGQYLKKGRQVYVEGKLQTRQYEKDGDKRYITEVVINQVVFLGAKGDAPAQTQETPKQQQLPTQPPPKGREPGSDDNKADYGPPPGFDDQVPF